MPTPQELESRLWKSLDSDRTVMLGLDGVDGGHARPMTTQVEGERSPLWFFTANDTVLVQQLAEGRRACVHFSSKGHDLFASMQGTLSKDDDRATIDRLWNPFVAAWFGGGKDDPKLALLRFDAEHAEIWENASSLLSGVKLLLGVDPKRDYRDKVARVDLH
ncbi:MAG: ral stress protein [Xanthomonadaceae bacterium]|nr:ral stress protein [Xanthomonadaceae bacterium]